MHLASHTLLSFHLLTLSFSHTAVTMSNKDWLSTLPPPASPSPFLVGKKRGSSLNTNTPSTMSTSTIMHDILQRRRLREFQAAEERIVHHIDRFLNNHASSSSSSHGTMNASSSSSSSVSSAARRQFITSIQIELRELLRRTVDSEVERSQLLDLLAEEREKVKDLIVEKSLYESNNNSSQRDLDAVSDLRQKI